MSNRFVRMAVALATMSMAGLLAVAAPAAATAQPATATRSSASTTLVPPTNLRITGISGRSVTFQWDHAQGVTGGCNLPIFQYDVYRDGGYVGSTYVGSPVAVATNLQPGQTYRYQVQGRDNCSGRLTALSAPLNIQLPRP